jgi:predicted nucleic acid-binding protein
MGDDVMIDSNIFISLIKMKGNPEATLVEWAADRNLIICGIVRLEVLRGIKSPKTFARVAAFMDIMENVTLDKRVCDEATKLAWKMDRTGIVIPSTDLLIAACAIRKNAAVLTSDAHFSRIDGLEVIPPPGEWLS